MPVYFKCVVILKLHVFNFNHSLVFKGVDVFNFFDCLTNVFSLVVNFDLLLCLLEMSFAHLV